MDSDSLSSVGKKNNKKLPPNGSKKRKVSKKLPKIVQKKQSVEKLLVNSISAVGISDTFVVSNDKIETVLKYKKFQEKEAKKKKTEESEEDNDDDDDSTFALTSPGKSRNGDLSSVHSRSAVSTSLYSNNADDMSYSSSTSMLSQYTSHELVAKINARALKNKPPPDFVPQLQTLPPSLLSWNNRLPSNYNPDNPPVNIVPCLVPLEVILAKADRRIRNRAKASKERKKQSETRLQKLEQSLEFKRTRAERMAAKLALQQLQCAWMRTIIIARYVASLKPKYEQSLRVQRDWFYVVKSARIVQKLFFRWYYREVRARLQRKYLGAFSRVENTLKLHLRIFRKRMAVRKLKSFLREFKGQHRMSVVVHRFLHSVRKIQRNIRAFINCKYAKITVLTKIWDKLEHTFIRKKLAQRKAKIAGATTSKKLLDKTLSQINAAALEEIKEKEKEWHKIHRQMEEVVIGLRLAGVIKDETEEEMIEKLKVPTEMKRDMLRVVLEKLRKSFYSEQRAQLKKKIDQDSCFNESHAANLLLGDGREVMRLFREKLNKKLVNLKYKPFMLFSHLDKRIILEKVKEAHTIRETFKIKVDV